MAKLQATRRFPGHDLEYILERGDPGQGRLIEIRNEWGDQTPVFKRSRPTLDDNPEVDPPLIGTGDVCFRDAW